MSSLMTKEGLLGLYSNQQLTDYAKGLNALEICELQKELAGPHDITQGEAIVLDSLYNELAYRESNAFLATKTITPEMSETEALAVTNYNHIARMVSQDEVELSVSYLSDLGIDTNGLFDKYPMMLSMENLSRIYEALVGYGCSEEEIQTMLINDSIDAFYSEEIFKSGISKKDTVKTNLTSKRFKDFVKKNINCQSLCQRVIVK